MSNSTIINQRIRETFSSERILFRLPEAEDAEVVNRAIVEQFPALKQWIPWARMIPSVADTEAYLKTTRAKWILREQFFWLMFAVDSKEFLGCIGVPRLRWDIGRFEVGYWAAKTAEGRGFVTEAVRQVTQFLFDDLKARKVEIRCDARNIASRRVAEKAGFTFEALLRNDAADFNTGDPTDTVIFASLAQT